MTEATHLEDQLRRLECHFTWDLKKEDIDLTDLLNRLEQCVEFKRGGEEGVIHIYNCLAFVRYLLGSPEDAFVNFKKSEELRKEYYKSDCDKWLIVTYGNIAWLKYHMECFDESESYLEKLREIATKFPTESASILHHEVLGEKAWALFKFSRNYYERAKECFKKALEMEPNEVHWNSGYAFVLHRTENDFSTSVDSQVVKQLRRALETNQDNNELRVLLALRLLQLNENDEAESLMEKALEESPNDPYVIRYVGKFLRSDKSVGRSIALLKRALENSPNSGFIHHQLALCYRTDKISLQEQGSKDTPEVQKLRRQCIYHLEKATTLKTSFIPAMIELAAQYGEHGKLDQAEELFQELQQLVKDKKEFQQSVYFHAAQFQQYRKRSGHMAIKYYMECLKINHDSFDGERSAKKLTMIAKKDLKRNPQDARALGILGFIHKIKGEKLKAIEYYGKACQFKAGEYLSELCELQLSLKR